MNVEELKAALSEMEASAKDFGGRLKALEELKGRIDDLETKMNRPALAGDPPGSKSSHEAKAVLVNFLRTGTGFEEKAMQGNVGSAGGFAVPAEIDRVILDQLATISPVRSVAQVVATQSGDYSKLIGRRGMGSGWTSETGTRSSTNTPQLAKVRPSMGELYTYGSVTRHLLEDALFDVNSWLLENITTEFAVQEGAAFVSGDGLNKPTGFLAGEPPVTAGDAAREFGVLQYVPTGASGAFAAEDPEDVLIDTVAALAPGYRANAAWMMNSSTAATVRKLKDADGRSLWSESLSEGAPNRLLGYPVVEAEDMPNIGANSLSIAFGNWQRGYLIADRAGTTMIRDEVTQPGFVKIYVARRVGGSLADSNAVKLVKFAAS